MSIKSERIRSQIVRSKELPTLPSVVTRILRLVGDPKSTAIDLNKIISSDMALASKILRLANSAFYGMSRQVSTVTEAIVYLGFDMVKGMVISISVFEAFKGTGVYNGYFNREALWRHAIACGVISRALSRQVRYGEQETVFLSGLLHDIGKVVIDRYHHEEFLKILELAGREKLYIQEAEEEILGTNHAEVGYWLAEWWKLPDVLSLPIHYHHEPKIYQRDKSVAIVHVADALCRQLRLGNSGDALLAEIDPQALALLNLPPSIKEEVEVNVHSDVENAEVFLSLVECEN